MYKGWSKSNVTQCTALFMGAVWLKIIDQNLSNQNFNSIQNLISLND